jgi:sugar phosphate isomerase/epimerase
LAIPLSLVADTPDQAEMKDGKAAMLFGAMNSPVKPVVEEIRQIGELGFDYVELAMDPPQAHYRQLSDLAPVISRTLSTYGMDLICHLPTFVYTADLTESIRVASLEEMSRSLMVAAELNAIKVVVHPSVISGLGVLVMETALQLAMDALSGIIAQGETLGLDLCLENMFPRCRAFYEPAHFEPLMMRYPSLRLTLDTGHANIDSPGGRRAIGFIDRFGSMIGHLHVSDNNGKRDDHLPVGKGNIDFKSILRRLIAAGFDHTVTIEVFSDDRRDVKASRERIASAARR